MSAKNDGLLAAIKQIEQAERDRALVSVLGATDASRYVRGIAHVPTPEELEDLFRVETVKPAKTFKVLTDDKIAESEDRS